jgi:hypothetical protein
MKLQGERKIFSFYRPKNRILIESFQIPPCISAANGFSLLFFKRRVCKNAAKGLHYYISPYSKKIYGALS